MPTLVLYAFIVMCHRLFLWVAVGLVYGLTGCSDEELSSELEDSFSPVRTAQEEMETFKLAPGLRIELVASEPLVEDPVVITFD